MDTMNRLHYRVYVADAELIAEARTRQLAWERIKDLRPAAEFDADEDQDEWIGRAAAALGPYTEYYICVTVYDDCESCGFCSAADSHVDFYQFSRIQ